MELDRIAGKKKKLFYYSEGKIFFARETERLIYFILMLVMAGAGILFKLGIL